MRTIDIPLSQVRHRWLFIGLVLVLSACFPSGPTHREWTEDVLLDDGTTIQVERTVAFNESNSLSGDAYNAVETEATIAFTGDLNHLPRWNQPLMALVMYRDKVTSEWVVVATTTSSDVSLQRGRPCPSYWEFRLHGQEWRETPLSLISIGRRANLLSSYQPDLKKRQITVEDRQRLDTPVRPFASMSPIEKSFRIILSKDQAKCPS